MEYVFEGASIECNSALISTRKIIKTSILNIPAIGVCKKYKCSRNSDVTILKELNPKTALINKNSFLNIEDKIKAETIIVITTDKKDIILKKTPYTGRHKSQIGRTNNFTQGIISETFPNLNIT